MGLPIVFIHPGLNNSGPQHWQTYWENEYGYKRINQSNWDAPVCSDWIKTIEETFGDYPLEQVIIVAHSLACNTIVNWAKEYNRVIKAALLVGPSDTEADSYPPGTTGFKPMPLFKLPFHSIVVASTNDEYVSMERAKYFAAKWGSDLIIVGDKGHLNTASNLGNWPEGHAILQNLINHNPIC